MAAPESQPGSFRIGQDMKGRGSASVALTLSGDMLQGNLRLKNPNSRGSIEEISRKTMPGRPDGQRRGAVPVALHIDNKFYDATASLAESLRLRGDLTGARNFSSYV